MINARTLQSGTDWFQPEWQHGMTFRL